MGPCSSIGISMGGMLSASSAVICATCEANLMGNGSCQRKRRNQPWPIIRVMKHQEEVHRFQQ